MNDDLLATLLDDPERLTPGEWAEVEVALTSDAELRERLRRDFVMSDRLSRLLDPDRGDLAAAVRWRIGRSSDTERFVRTVMASSRAAQRWTRRRVIMLAAATALAAGLVVAVQWSRAGALAAPVADLHGPGQIAIAGASVRLGSDAVLRTGVVPVLLSGHAEFAVDPHPPTDPFVLRVPHAIVTVLGTRFAIGCGDATLVEVEHGRVRIDSGPNHTTELVAGERDVFGVAGAIGASRRLVRFFPPGQMSNPGFEILAASEHGPDGDELAALAIPPSYSGVRVRFAADEPSWTRTAAGQRVTLRYRLTRPVRRVELQSTNVDRNTNYISPPLPSEAGRWHDVEVPFVTMHPVETAAGAWQLGDRAHDVLLYVDAADGSALRVAEIGIVATR